MVIPSYRMPIDCSVKWKLSLFIFGELAKMQQNFAKAFFDALQCVVAVFPAPTAIRNAHTMHSHSPTDIIHTCVFSTACLVSPVQCARALLILPFTKFYFVTERLPVGVREPYSKSKLESWIMGKCNNAYWPNQTLSVCECLEWNRMDNEAILYIVWFRHVLLGVRCFAFIVSPLIYIIVLCVCLCEIVLNPF